jgi:F-type H+-transporting ATPase subunit gamma
MANLRDIRNRINSVENTQQVTRAMKMVAAAKLRRAQESIFQTRPYAYKLRELVEHLKDELDPTSHELFPPRDAVDGALVIVITADRGLAGAFNSNVIKRAEQTIEEHYAHLRKRGALWLLCVGRKGHEHFAKRNYQLVGDFRNVFDGLSFGVGKSVAERAIEGYLDGTWDEVHMVYNEFKNTISQNRIVEPLIPVPDERFATPVMEEEFHGFSTADVDKEIDYIFEPGPEALLNKLVPRFLHYQVWRALLESNAAEQGARMVAMDNATSNAEELLEDLRLEYNRARQDAITTEILEITSGAEALESAQ